MGPPGESTTNQPQKSIEALSTVSLTESGDSTPPPTLGNKQKIDEVHQKPDDGFTSFLRNILNKDIDSVRISIPMFCLEPISSLEFITKAGRVDDLVLATYYDDPLDRMLCVLRLYFYGLAEMHVRGKVKKPLNPVLGETLFVKYEQSVSKNQNSILLSQCSSSESGDTSLFTNSTLRVGCSIESPLNNKIPLPNVYQVGEQVSHHPPISACHLTCPEKRVSATMVFSPAARFNGISIIMCNKAVGEMYLGEHDETYQATYPDAMICGVLTMSLRFLWTGSCSIVCPKTSLKVNITFKNQSFIGRDTYELTGTIEKMKNGEEEAILIGNISGSWNKEIIFRRINSQSKKSNSKNGKKTKSMTSASSHDTSSINSGNLTPVGPDIIYNSNDSSDYIATTDERSSSRSIWTDVVKAMRSGDSTTAKRLKSEIETNQRNLERTRCSNHLPPHRPKYFTFEPNFSDNKQNKNETTTLESSQTLKSNVAFDGVWKYIGPLVPEFNNNNMDLVNGT